MTAPTQDEARAVLRGLLNTPSAVVLEEPISVGTILSLAEEVSRARAERDELAERITAARRGLFLYLRENTQRGNLARDIEADLDPRHEQDPAA